jgi:hypothetical protein
MWTSAIVGRSNLDFFLFFYKDVDNIYNTESY